jgi:hypothetical protein
MSYVMTVLIAAVVRGLDTTVTRVVSALVLFPLMLASLVPTSQNLGLIYVYWRRRAIRQRQAKLWRAGLLRHRQLVTGLLTSALYVIATI